MCLQLSHRRIVVRHRRRYLLARHLCQTLRQLHAHHRVKTQVLHRRIQIQLLSFIHTQHGLDRALDVHWLSLGNLAVCAASELFPLS